MYWFQLRFWLGMLVAMLTFSATAGGLGDLKKKTEVKAEKKKREESRKPKENNGHGASLHSTPFGSGTYPSDSGGSSLLGGLWGWMVAGPFAYLSEDPSTALVENEEDWADAPSDGLMRLNHESGQPVMPYIRADLNWQYIDSDNEAFDGRLEAGYKMFGFIARTTKYDDSLQNLSQRISQYYGIVRYGGRWPGVIPGAFEVGIGLGVADHSGDLSDDSSAAFTVPVKYYPTDWLGFEFRGAWYEGDYAGIDYDIGDYDLSASIGLRYVQLRAGYRWLWFSSLGQTLDGPYAGVSLSF